MRKTYRSSQLLEILHLTVWKYAKVLDYSNLEHVYYEFDALGSESKISARYLKDMLKDSKESEEVSLDDKFFNQILFFLGFKDFGSFEDHQRKLAYYLNRQHIDLTNFKELKTAVFFPTEESYSVEKYLETPEKALQVNYELISNPADNLVEVMKELEQLKKEFPFIIWCISEDWKSQFDEEEHKLVITELLFSKQIIPIFLADDVFSNTLISPNVKTELSLSGIISLFMALFHIDREVAREISDRPNGNNRKEYGNVGVSVTGNVGEIYHDNIFEAQTMNFGNSSKNKSTND